MSNPPIFPYARHHLDEEDRAAVMEALSSPTITRGPITEAFEKEVALYCDVPYAVSFNSGTSALSAAYSALGLKSGDRVITSPNTFIGTVAHPLSCHTPIHFCDIDRATGALDQKLLKQLLDLNPSRASTFLLPVHYGGAPFDITQLERLITDEKTVILEDASTALGATYPDGKRVGACHKSDITTFSLHPSKTITCGEGGICTTADRSLYKRLLAYRNNGIRRGEELSLPSPPPWYYEVEEATGNFHLTEFQAALALSQLKKIDHFVAKRRLLVEEYRKLLAKLPNCSLLSPSDDALSSHHLMVALIDYPKHRTTRASVMERLAKEGVMTAVHYIPLYRHPCFAKKRDEAIATLPEAELFYSQALTLPLYFDLTVEDVHTICTALKRCLKL